MPLPQPSAFLVASFWLLAIVVASALPALLYVAGRRLALSPAVVRRSVLGAAFGAAAWMTMSGVAAASGRLTFSGEPPTAMLLFPVVGVLGFGIGLSPIGRRLAAGAPLALLVGLQAFRLPLELAMHRAATEGLMPIQMSFSGRNFDILTGVGALVLAPLVAAGRAPRALVGAWNVVGSLLLLNVLVVAALSTPTALRRFTNEPPNVWITQLPFVWLPAVLVVTAIYGHIVVFRALRSKTADGSRVAGVPAA